MKAFWHNVDSSLYKPWSLWVGRGHNRENHMSMCLDWKQSTSSEPAGQIQSNLVQIILGWMEFKFVQIKGQVLFKGRDNHKNLKMGWSNLNILSRTTGLILARLGTNHPRIKRIQVSLKEGGTPSPMGDNSKIVKIHRNFFKIFFSRTSRPKSIKFGTNYRLVKTIQVCSNKGPVP